jgi:hypothetical protein
MIEDTEHETWQQDGLTFTEQYRNDYTNCSISAGTIEGHEDDTMYLRLHRHSEPGVLGDDMTYLRPDEAAAIIWCLSGVLRDLLDSQVQE